MTRRPTTHRYDSNEVRLRRAIARFLAELRALAELSALPPEPVLIPIPEAKPRTGRPR